MDQEEPELMLHAILDAISIFLLHNLKKSISMDLYTTALDVLQRIILLAFQTRKRLFYDWPKLWNGLMTLSRFWASNKKHVVSYASSEMLVRKVWVFKEWLVIFGA